MSIRRTRPQAARSALNELDYDPSAKKKLDLLQQLRPKKSNMEPVHSKYAARLEQLRTSPYMFFHGESSEYSEAVKAREEEQHLWMKRTEAITKPDPKKAAVFGYSPVVAPPPPIPLLVDNIFDDLNSDGFAGGTVLKTAEMIRQRRRKMEAVNAEVKQAEVTSPNLSTVKKLLAKCAVDGSSAAVNQPGWSFSKATVPPVEHTEVVLNVSALKREFKFTYDITSEQALDVFFRDIASRPPGRPAPETLQFHQVMDLFENYLANEEHVKETAEACFKVIDLKDCQTISLNSLRELRGRPELPRDMTFAMLKCTINAFLIQPIPVLTMSQTEFTELFKNSDELVTGFMPEILKHILVKRFNHDRFAIAGFFK